MELNVDHANRCVAVWLPNDVKDIAVLDPLYKHYKEARYRVIVFKSGKGDLTADTAALLKLNRG